MTTAIKASEICTKYFLLKTQTMLGCWDDINFYFSQSSGP